jgi:hypothetical protein
MQNLSLFSAAVLVTVAAAVAAHEPDTMPERLSLRAVEMDRAFVSRKSESNAVSISTDALMVAAPLDRIPLTIDDPLDPSTVAYDLTMTWMKGDEWHQKVSALKAKYQDWENTNGGDIGQYLNDRLVMVAMGAANGKIDSLKNGFIWLAYYKEFNQQVPSLVSTIMRDHKSSLMRLFKDFTWEKASQYVKNKEWRSDKVKQ